MFSLRNVAKLGSNTQIALMWQNSVRLVSNAKIERLEKIRIPENNSFVQNIFTGEAKVTDFFPYPRVLNEEQLSFIDMVTEPASKIFSLEYDPLKVEETETLSDRHLQILKDIGSFGMQVPQEFGGMGCNNTQYARLAELTSGEDLAISAFLGAHQAIGYKGLLLFGTDKQKEEYLPILASGEKLAAFALTEPSAGSDAAGIKSRAVLSDDGKHWILNGSKIWISNGGIADYFTVFAKTPLKTWSGEVRDKVTAFWVPRGPGVTSGPPLKKMGIRASNTTEVFFDNVHIPVENVIAEVGEGFKVAMNILNNGRYGMCCALTGTMKKAIDIASAHANNRSQFGNKLASFTGIQEKIARMTVHHYITQSLSYMLSGLMDKGFKDFHLEAAISKIYASEAASYVVDETLQILGGMGYMRETGVEKMVRDVRIFRIFEGANEVLRLFVALTGIQYAGGNLREIQQAMKNPAANLGVIFNEGSRRVRRLVGLDTPNIAKHVHEDFIQEAQQLSKNIIEFSSAVEHLLIKYTRDIIHEQILLTRLSNAAIDIYVSLVVLSRVTRALNKNVIGADMEKLLARVALSEANIKIQQNLRSLRSKEALNNDEHYRAIARDVLKNGGVIHHHPLD